MNYNYTTTLIYLLLIFAPITTIGQNNDFISLKSEYNQKYGLDTELYNGKKYYPSHTNAKGHPYLMTNIPQSGSIIILGKRFDNKSLKYNIYNQKIILNYYQFNGALSQLEILQSSIDTVILQSNIGTIGFQNRIFIQNKFDEINTSLIQIIHEAEYSLYLSWSKDYNFRAEASGGNHHYSKDKRKIFLITDSVRLIKKRKDFLNSFDAEKRDELKNFFKEHKIKIKKASEFELNQLMEFCNEKK